MSGSYMHAMCELTSLTALCLSCGENCVCGIGAGLAHSILQGTTAVRKCIWEATLGYVTIAK